MPMDSERLSIFVDLFDYTLMQTYTTRDIGTFFVCFIIFVPNDQNRSDNLAFVQKLSAKNTVFYDVECGSAALSILFVYLYYFVVVVVFVVFFVFVLHFDEI